MGVYIRGMEMPKSCANCPLRCYDRDDHKFCGATGKAIRFGIIRPFDCPLVSVPDHERLIDADALLLHLLTAESGKVYYYCYPCKEVIQAINEMPTIIPAEEDET